MMGRAEFTGKTKAQAFERQQGNCAHCGLKIVGGAEYDHVIPCALGGDNSLSNCEALCSKCHRIKTTSDVGRIAKAERQHRKAIGAHTPKARIPRSLKRAREPRDKLALPPRRDMFRPAPIYPEIEVKEL